MRPRQPVFAGAGADLDRLLTARLDFTSLSAPDAVRSRGDRDLNPGWGADPAQVYREAAVLIAIIAYRDGPKILLTQRPDHLPNHPGQVSFPGGRIETHDDGPVAAAIREAEEEVGLPPHHVTVRGTLDPYRTGTGFRIMPVVATVEPGFAYRIDPGEVASVFEVPLDFLMDPANHERRSTVWQGKERHYYAMPYDGHFIWGATAGMLVNLYERLLGPSSSEYAG